MTDLYANPYAYGAQGFFFDSAESFEKQIKSASWEECSIEYIDGDNPKLFAAAGIHQGNVHRWFEDLDHLSDEDDEGIAIRYLLDDVGYDLDQALERANDVQLYRGTSADYAAELLADCYEINKLPSVIRYHIDYEGIARDMEINSEITEIGYELWVTNRLEF